MEKTALEWFETLPGDVGVRAIQNTNKLAKQSGRDLLTKKFNSLHSALAHCFYWGAAEESPDYWCEIHLKAMRGHYDDITVTPIQDLTVGSMRKESNRTALLLL